MEQHSKSESDTELRGHLNSLYHERQNPFYVRFRSTHPNVSFPFTDLPTSEHLEYEMLSEYNFFRILKMFRSDENPFVTEKHKNETMLVDHVDFWLNYLLYSPKHGGCNWLCRMKGTNEYVGDNKPIRTVGGITYGESNRMCQIGYATCEEYRNRNLTSEAVRQMLDSAFGKLNLLHIYATTDADNVNSRNFLQKLGFRPTKEKHVDFLLQREDFYTSEDATKKNL